MTTANQPPVDPFAPVYDMPDGTRDEILLKIEAYVFGLQNMCPSFMKGSQDVLAMCARLRDM